MQVSCACARDKSKKSDQISIPERVRSGSIKPHFCGFFAVASRTVTAVRDARLAASPTAAYA